MKIGCQMVVLGALMVIATVGYTRTSLARSNDSDGVSDTVTERWPQRNHWTVVLQLVNVIKAPRVCIAAQTAWCTIPWTCSVFVLCLFVTME